MGRAREIVKVASSLPSPGRRSFGLARAADNSSDIDVRDRNPNASTRTSSGLFLSWRNSQLTRVVGRPSCGAESRTDVITCRAHATDSYLVCRLLLEKKNTHHH